MKVSIVVPLYNSERYIYQTIDSLLNQTLSDFELIIVNDCSNDQSLYIVHEFMDKRIKIVNQDINRGCSSSRNLGISIAQGEYIAFADSDDLYEKSWLESSIDFLEKKESIQGVCSWINIIDKDNNNIGSWTPPTNFDEIKTNILFESVFANPTFVGRSSFVKTIYFDENLKFCEDLCVYLNSILSGAKIVNIPNFNCNYRVNDDGLTESSKKNTILLTDVRQSIYESSFRKTELVNVEFYNKEMHQLVVEGSKLSYEQYKDLVNYISCFYGNCNKKYFDEKSINKKISNLITYVYIRTDFSLTSGLYHFFDSFYLDCYNIKNKLKKLLRLIF
ncbi:glycosyltransferase family 2 protein [Vibrio parahaemolyticus]